jgi:hypothetical protein
MRPMPDFPAATFCHAAGAFNPTGLIAPMPVTTTRRELESVI